MRRTILAQNDPNPDKVSIPLVASKDTAMIKKIEPIIPVIVTVNRVQVETDGLQSHLSLFEFFLKIKIRSCIHWS